MDENERRRRRREIQNARRAVLVILITMISMIAVVVVSTVIVSARQAKLGRQMERLEARLDALEKREASYTGPSEPEQTPVLIPEDTEDKEPEETEGKEQKETETELLPTEETEETETETETEEGLYSPDSVNYLAIGNSITRHQLSDYWWGDWGMAASTEDKDYFHLVKQKLKDKFGKVTARAYNFYAWEPQGTDRAEALTLLENYLSEDLNYVSIQLGENVSDTATFEADFDELIRFIQARAPKAMILIVGNFWTNNMVDELKMRVAIKYSLPCIDLAEIRDNAAYQCGMGTIVYDADGNPHQIAHEGAAKHPNDAAMAYMADKIFDAMMNFQVA